MVLARFDGRDEFGGLLIAFRPGFAFVDAAPVLCPEAQLADGLGLGIHQIHVQFDPGLVHWSNEIKLQRLRVAARDTERGRDPRLVGAGQIEGEHLPEGRLIGFGARTDERNEQPENPEHRQQPAQGAALFGMRVGLVEVGS